MRVGAPSVTAALVGLVAAAFSLRIAIIGIGPVIEDIRADTGMSSTMAGILTTIPFACLSVFSLAGITLGRRLGPERLVSWCVVIIGVGTVLRAVMPTPILLILGTIPIGIGIALAGVMLPGIVKRHFPRRAGAATGAYVASMSVGGAVAALTMVPLADALGGWRWAFVVSAAPALPAWWLWQRTLARDPSSELGATSGPISRRPSRVALLLSVLFGVQSMCFAATVTWVAALYIDNGWSRADAALTTASIPVLTIVAALVVPPLSDRGNRRAWLVAMGAALTGGMLGLALAPTAAPILWMTLFGIGAGALFPLGLTLPLDLREHPNDVTDLSAWMLGLGYVLSAIGPVLVGALRDATGDFTLGFLLLAAGAAIYLVVLIPNRFARAVTGA